MAHSSGGSPVGRPARNVLLNPGAGDPLVLMQRAVREVAQRERNSGPFAVKSVLMDIDRVINDRQRKQQTEALAAQNGIAIIWQNHCHETSLLHHFPGHKRDMPPTSDLALEALQAIWPGYVKGTTSVNLERRLDLDGVQRAATVERDLAAFLRQLGLIS